MVVPNGFFAAGLKTGTFTFVVMGVAASVAAWTCFAKETPNVTIAESRRLGVAVVSMSAFCMWLMWACVYMHQMVPIIYPEHTHKHG
mmetsp:Transcript_128476/g.256651  ORF Transcript_128476/g.256651 Transcript_128476/m.256651 type:complete len:87 (-) Transcript_128476:84-344(-)